MNKVNSKLGALALTAIVVSAMIGGGIFSLPQNMAQSAGLTAVILAWIITGIGIFFLQIFDPFQNSAVYIIKNFHSLGVTFAVPPLWRKLRIGMNVGKVSADILKGGTDKVGVRGENYLTKRCKGQNETAGLLCNDVGGLHGSHIGRRDYYAFKSYLMHTDSQHSCLTAAKVGERVISHGEKMTKGGLTGSGYLPVSGNISFHSSASFSVG